MRLSQILTPGGAAVVVRDGSVAHILPGVESTDALARPAADCGQTIGAGIAAQGLGATADLVALAAPGQSTHPIMHPDPGHLHLTGTGLTDPGPAATRNARQVKTDADDATDPMKMFRMGLENGKPPVLPGVQPEWFYKGNGHSDVAPGVPITSPGFALDAGEKTEIAGIYIIAADGTPARIGWTLADEFSDHVTERINDLDLAYSKLRLGSFGPETLIGDLPADMRSTSRIRRDGGVIWEKPFLSGVANRSHSFANLEHHHFKYHVFCQPGDLHVQMCGTATLSFADGIKPMVRDSFEIEAAAFGLPLINPLAIAADRGVATVKPL